MHKEIYELVINKLLSEFSSMGGGSVGGVATPLGTGANAGSKGENIYKAPEATDTQHRSKKKKSPKKRSVQWYLKHGSSKSLKEVMKYYLGSILKESRTARIKDFKKSEIISFLKYLKGEVEGDITFSATEKIAGQSMTVGIKGSQRGNVIYCAAKDMLVQENNDIFNYRFIRSKGTSGLVKSAFIKKFRKLSTDEEVVLGMEIIINDHRKPDYIAYHVPIGKEYAAIFSIKPEGSFTRQDADRLSGKYWNRRRRKNTELEVLLPEDIPLVPDVNIDAEVVREIDELIQIVEQAPLGRGKDPDTPVKTFINKEVSPRIRSLVKVIFPASNLNPSSPIEGIAVNMTSGGNTSFFKVPNEDFDNLQSIQSSVYAEFKSNRYASSSRRAQGFIDQLNNPTTAQSFARNTFKLIKYLNDTDTLPLNYRTFFSPIKLRSFCKLLKSGLETANVDKISSAIDLFSKSLYTSKGTESFSSQESEALVQFIEQNNLI
jgi:hypothetical protein